MKPAIRPPLTSTFLLLADPQQLESLFILAAFAPFVVGRVHYIETKYDWDVLRHNEKENHKSFTKVEGYNIAIVFEKILGVYDAKDSIVNAVKNMATFFKKERIDKAPLKYAEWKEKL